MSCILSPLCIPKGGYVFVSLVVSQGGGIHAEEEFDLWIRVNGSFSPVDHTNCLQVAIETHSS